MKYPIITLQEHGGRTRSMLTIEVGRRNSRAIQPKFPADAKKFVSEWIDREVKSWQEDQEKSNAQSGSVFGAE